MSEYLTNVIGIKGSAIYHLPLVYSNTNRANITFRFYNISYHDLKFNVGWKEKRGDEESDEGESYRFLPTNTKLNTRGEQKERGKTHDSSLVYKARGVKIHIGREAYDETRRLDEFVVDANTWSFRPPVNTPVLRKSLLIDKYRVKRPRKTELQQLSS